MPKDLLSDSGHKQAQNIDRGEIRTPCNTDKTCTFSCLLKCKTRGVELSCTTFAVIIGIRNMYGSESLTQMAQMYLDMSDHFTCKKTI